MVHIPYLQAFDDVNKRTSRLAANIPLIQKNFCPLSFIDLPEEAYINGLLGIYETQKVDLLCDIFEWAYERSCFLYSNARQITGEPDPFRLKYRKNLQLIIGEVVRSGMNKLQAIKVTHQYSHKEIPNQDQLRFIEIVERELQGLHEGNIARYQIGPLHYERWKQNWY
jgi:Fic family protein